MLLVDKKNLEQFMMENGFGYRSARDKYGAFNTAGAVLQARMPGCHVAVAAVETLDGSGDGIFVGYYSSQEEAAAKAKTMRRKRVVNCMYSYVVSDVEVF